MKKFFANWWFIGGLIVLLLVLVLCVGLPIFVSFLKPMWVRLTIGGVLTALWLGIGLLRWRKRVKAARALEAELNPPSAADEESRVIAQRMSDALKALKNHPGARKDYLYSKPWYVIVGPPGSGKTTALLNSGLRFPFSEQSLKGIGGTRNLDFWFTDEAVLVDTAGRYTTQDSDSAVDSSGWQSLLRQLRKHRPLTPINGIIVTLAIDELVAGDRASLDRHASVIRRRLSEMREMLEFAVPVYLMFTKADLLAGFVEYYDDLDVEGRRAVLGATLPVGPAGQTIDEVIRSFDRFVASQGERQARRLFEEVDQRRRGLILGFPGQLAALRNRFVRFVDGAFLAGDLPAGNLRGFYFTSGMQEGAPLDRILSGVSEIYDAPAGPEAMRGSGRTYFLNRLLNQVIFAEAGLVQADPAAIKRQRLQFTVGMASVAAVSALLLAAWGISFFRNLDFLSELDGEAARVATLTRETGIDLARVGERPTLEHSLDVLKALRNLPQGYADQAEGEPGLLMRFGLYRSGQSDEAVEAYRDGLRRIMLPRLLLRIEDYIARNKSDPMLVYQPLKAYLMLGGEHALDPGAVRTWVVQDWETGEFAGDDNAEIRTELVQHLDALLEDTDLLAAWPQGYKPLSNTTLADARLALRTLGAPARAYAVMKLKALASGNSPMSFRNVFPEADEAAFANGAEMRALEVPYFFTSEGYKTLYRIGRNTAAADVRKDRWIFGDDSSVVGAEAGIAEIRSGVAELYAQDYIAAWKKVVSTPRPADYFGDTPESNDARAILTKSPSPLEKFLLKVRANTTFNGADDAALKAAGEAVSSSRLGNATRLAGQIAGAANVPNFDAAGAITSAFSDIHTFVGDSSSQDAPLDRFLKNVDEAGRNKVASTMPGTGGASEMAVGNLNQSMAALISSVGSIPPLLRPFADEVVTGGRGASLSAAKGAISDAYTASVLPACQAAVEGKYPFVNKSDQDASPTEVQRAFDMNGAFDTFVQQRSDMLEKGPVWRWKAEDATAATLNAASADAFRQAMQLRDMIGGFTVYFEVKAFGAGVDKVQLVVGNTTHEFTKGAGAARRPVTWTLRGNVPQASVTLYQGGRQVDEIAIEDSDWALFRLMDRGSLRKLDARTLNATFGRGAGNVAFKVTVPATGNPFGESGLWNFHCPAAL